MKKTLIMSMAVLGSLVCGDALMAMVFALVMVSGLLAGCLVSESTLQLIECPLRVLRLAPKKRQDNPV